MRAFRWTEATLEPVDWTEPEVKTTVPATVTDDGVEVRKEVVTTWERHYLAGGGPEALLYMQAGEAVTPEMCVAVQCHLKASPKAALRGHRFAARARKRILPH